MLFHFPQSSFIYLLVKQHRCPTKDNGAVYGIPERERKREKEYLGIENLRFVVNKI